MELSDDLFIVTPEEELTEFENTFGRAMMEVPEPEEKEEWYQFLKEKAAELLDLARTELICQGNIVLSIEEFEKCFIEAQEKGRKEALKDLPRWETIKKDDTIAIIPYVSTNMLGEKMLYIGENAISISCLMKLPGFKED